MQHMLDVNLPVHEFLEELSVAAAQSRAANHPLLRLLSTGDLPDARSVMTSFLSEYAFYNKRFTQLLAAVTAKLGSPKHRLLLMPNALEESGYLDEETREEIRQAGLDPQHMAAPHTVLFERMLEAIDIEPESLNASEPSINTSTWIHTLLAVCESSPPEVGIGALGIGTEGIVKPIYKQIAAGMRRAWPSLTPREMAFFDLHVLVDDEHAHALTSIAADFCAAADGRRRLMIGVFSALNARSTYFDSMYELLARRQPAA